jgi:hypothetical protein
LNFVLYYFKLIFFSSNNLVMFVVLKDLKLDGFIFLFRLFKVINNRLNLAANKRVYLFDLGANFFDISRQLILSFR